MQYIESRKLSREEAASAYFIPPPMVGILDHATFGNIEEQHKMLYQDTLGPHLQEIQQEMDGIPKIRSQRIFSGGSAHREGWALYTERLAVEQGWYKDDVPGLRGALGSELFRARRLVVDTGLHTKNWTRQQAVDYGINVEEVDRYVAWPGQATAYMIGMLRIVELREKAKTELGAKFSLPGFHDMVLSAGSVPLDVLGQLVDQWIAKEKAKA
jgi:uncharacterized protein (DUF885 family)